MVRQAHHDKLVILSLSKDKLVKPWIPDKDLGNDELKILLICVLFYLMELIDDDYCFVCGKKNPAGMKLDFSFDGKKIRTEFIPQKEHQGYYNIVHGGIISTLLDEAMVKLAIELGMPAVTAQMDIRLKKALNVGQKVIVQAEIVKDSRKLLEAYAKAMTADGAVVADATGKLMKVVSGIRKPEY